MHSIQHDSEHKNEKNVKMRASVNNRGFSCKNLAKKQIKN
jgi:hypothetical protein